MRWTEHVAHTVKKRNSCKMLVGKPEGTTEFEDLGVDRNIILKKNPIETGWRGFDWINLDENRAQWQHLQKQQ